jgi:hypothetical protein
VTKPSKTRRLQDLIDELPQELHPARDLWPGIAHDLLTTPANQSPRAYALAASVLLVLGLSLYFGLNQPLATPFDPALDNYISSLRKPHTLSKQTLLVEFEHDQVVYPGWRAQLHELEQAEDSIYDALRREPTNRELLKILRDVQSKQLKLIDAAFKPQTNSI